MTTAATPLADLQASWRQAWPQALACWSKYVKLAEPRWCLDKVDEKRHGLAGSFAMIRLTDQAIVVSLSQVADKHLECFAPEILAHEIGHHVYCPADLLNQGRMIARMRHSLPTRQQHAPFVANLYADLLINDRLQRVNGLSMAEVYRTLGGGDTSRMWTFYLRTYEILWGLAKGSLACGPIDDVLEGDARIGARLVRNFAKDWLLGAGRFAALCLPYLLEDDGKAMIKLLGCWSDLKGCGH